MSRKTLQVIEKNVETKRRAPSQDRAVQTIDTLFQATAQILEREGEAGLTTNKVASVAGFSIGTLYQYFPTKNALIQAMALRVQNQILDQIENYLSELLARKDLPQLDPYELVRQAIGLVLQSTTLKGKNKNLLRLFWILEPTDQTTVAAQRITEKLSIFFEQVQHPYIKKPTATELFVITRLISGVVRYACLEKSSLLGSEGLEVVLTDMVFRVIERQAMDK